MNSLRNTAWIEDGNRPQFDEGLSCQSFTASARAIFTDGTLIQGRWDIIGDGPVQTTRGVAGNIDEENGTVRTTQSEKNARATPSAPALGTLLVPTESLILPHRTVILAVSLSCRARFHGL
jgi:hypothetical protein